VRFEFNASSIGLWNQPDREIRDRQPRRFFGPFDEAYRLGVEVLVQPRGAPLVQTTEAIKIKVIEV
jgi:hypothetical protein